MRRESSLEPETLIDIQKVPDTARAGRGCMCAKQKDGRWYICGYHEGFDDGVSAAKETFMREAEAPIVEHFRPAFPTDYIDKEA